MVLSSRGNPRIKAIRALRRREEREQTGLAFVEGLRIVTEAAQIGNCLEMLVVAPSLLTSGRARWLVEQLQRDGVETLEVAADVFDSLSSRDGPQGLGAVVRQCWQSLAEVRLGRACWVVLEAIQDPGNLGTILRTSDGVGATGVVLVGQTADPFHPVAVRASMGAVFSQQIARASMAEAVEWARAGGGTLVGASPVASRDFREIEYRRPLMLLMGNEQRGLSADAMARCDIIARIPMHGRSDSLNLAVATGLMLYEAQRRCGSFS